MWSPPSLGDHFPTRIRKDVSGGLLHCFLLPFSTLPLNKKGLSLHATCNSMHSPCNLHKRHATPCICSATPLKLNSSKQPQSVLMHLASIIKVFEFCWYQLHMSSGTTALLNSCTHALLHLLSTLIRAPVSDTVTLICLHQSN